MVLGGRCIGPSVLASMNLFLYPNVLACPSKTYEWTFYGLSLNRLLRISSVCRFHRIHFVVPSLAL